MTTCTIKSCVSDFLSQASSPLLVIRIVLSKHPKGQMLVMFWHLRWQTELLSLENCKKKRERKQSAKQSCDAGETHTVKMSKGPKPFTPNGSPADSPPMLPLSLQYTLVKLELTILTLPSCGILEFPLFILIGHTSPLLQPVKNYD